MAENIQKNITRYTLNNAEIISQRNVPAGLLRGVSHLRGGAKNGCIWGRRFT
jgi:hypothetical protein